MLRFITKLALLILLLGTVTLAVIAIIIIPDLPEVDALRDVRMQVPLRVYSADGSLIAEFGEKRRIPVKIEDTPEQMVQAFLAAEDDRFYQHPGVAWQGIARAAYVLLKTGEKREGGSTITMQVARNFFLSREKSYIRKLNEIFLALKIEQELSKEEVLELYLNKIYLGHRAYGIGSAAQVYYGRNVNELTLPQIAMIAGLPKAPSTTNPVSHPERALNRRAYVLNRMLTQGYISREEYSEAMKAPVTAVLHSPDVELEAPYVAEMVRTRMLEMHGEEAYNAGYKVFTTVRDKNQVAANHALRESLLEYDRRHGYRGPEQHLQLEESGGEAAWRQLLEPFPVIGNLYPALVVEVHEQSVTAWLSGIGLIDIEWSGLEWARPYINENLRGAQPKTAGAILEPGDVIRIIEDNEGRWLLSQIPEVEGGMVSLDPNDGSVLALTGGFDFQRSKFNRITQAMRQPGSSFKPFVYSAALEAGYTAASIINDAPVVFDDPGIEDIWRPENYSRRYYGPTRLREALINSRNLVSIRLLHDIGVSFTLDHVEKFGYDKKQLPRNLSLALGSGNITPMQHARAFSVFANGGYRIEPWFLARIENIDDEIIYEHDPLVVCRDCREPLSGENGDNDRETNRAEETDNDPVNSGTDVTWLVSPDIAPEPAPRIAPRTVSEENVWIMNSITRDVIQHGTGRRARVLNRSDISGKTGTTNDQRDAWFAGFSPEVVAVSWVGFDNFQPLGNIETGARAALPMWIRYMRVALEGIPVNIPERPAGLVMARIDPDTGKLASPGNPDAIFEVFRSGNVPTEEEGRTAPDIFSNDGGSQSSPEQLF
ncbi:MAG: penicillin-binding protein 1A [Gammaproteobacteria bacterium]